MSFHSSLDQDRWTSANGDSATSEVSDEIDYCHALWLAILVVVVYLGKKASGFNLRQRRPRLALEVLIVDDRQRGQQLSHPVYDFILCVAKMD